MSANPFSTGPIESGGGGGGGVSGLTTADGGTAIADNAIIRGDGTTGIQGGPATLSDAGKFTTTAAASPQYGFDTTGAANNVYAGLGVSAGQAQLYGANAGGSGSVLCLQTSGNVGSGAVHIGDVRIFVASASATTPSIAPRGVFDENTGIGTPSGADDLSLIAGGVEILRGAEGVAGQSDGITYRLIVDTNTSGPVTVNATMADYGKWFCNTGAGGSITFNLPAAAVGAHYGFAVTATQNIVVDANGTDTIRIAGSASSAGGTATNGTIGSTLYLICYAAGEWTAAHAPNGTWTLA